MFKPTCLAFAATLIAITPAVAQIPAVAQTPGALSGKPTSPVRKLDPKLAPNALAGTVLPRKPLPFITFKPLGLDLKFIPLADMTGWTPVTAAPTVGGASLFTAGGQSRIAVTGGDNTVYIAPYNPAAPALVASTTWLNITKVSLWSEPVCLVTPFDFSDISEDYIFCLGLGEKGNAVGTTLEIDNHVGLRHVNGPVDLGGHGAGAAPVLLSTAQMSNDVPISATSKWYKKAEFSIAVWGGMGNPKLFAGRIDAGLAGASVPVAGMPGVAWSMNMAKASGGDWAPAGIPFTAAPACVPTGSPGQTADCAVAAADGTVTLYSIGASPASAKPWPNVSPALPAGLSGATALVRTKAGRLVIIARGKDGKIYRTVLFNSKFSPWTSEGGFMTSGTVPACVAINEAPTCVIQGPDGKLYGKVLQNAGAM